MTMIEIKVISTEMIKPSSPTPISLQIHHLSLLDQIAPPMFGHLIYFYSSNLKIPNSKKSDHLKKSLSETLKIFYPLAGRLVGNLHVDCNDAGVPFIEAEANCDLSLIIANPDPKNADRFMPYKIDELHDFPMAVQTTYFRCGGVAVALLISHKIADASSFTLFGKIWSAVAKNGAAAVRPVPMFDAATVFPPRDISGLNTAVLMQKEEIAARIFTFPTAKIAALQERYAAGGVRPSRMVALSSFIWTHFMSATKPDPSKTYAVIHAINLRTRADPPISEHLFGNIYSVSTAMPDTGDSGVEVVKKVREAMKAIDGRHVAWMKEGEGFFNMMKEMAMAMDSANKLVFFSFSSLCGFPLYETDFGWGRPVWVGQGGSPYANTVLFMDTKSGGGIEAMIHLTKQDMAKFEAHLELQMQMLKSNL